MHWAYRIAEELTRKYPDRETFVCASGISPSGSVHIGNFREVVTTYFVVRALQSMGKKTRFIFSWDDFDRFRKVPKNVDASFEQYIGLPYSEIPCPFGCHHSYSEHFEKEFETSLQAFGIVPEFIYQSKEYRSKRYNSQILHALNERKQIYDILKNYKTSEPCDEERENFYPVNVYCEWCRKDTVNVNSFKNGELSYSCSCGHSNSVEVLEAMNIKLNWKIDWPMRWVAEDVVFEPGGRDHSSATGSYRVSSEIVSKIFVHRAPQYEPYDFISIKGTGEKMSSSSGNNITPGELLRIYSPEVILFLFAKYQPNTAFHIGLDEDVIRNYTEFERYRGTDPRQVKEEIRAAQELSGCSTGTGKRLKFGQVASVLPLVNFNASLVRDVLEKTGEVYRLEEVEEVCVRAEYWLWNWCPKKVLHVRDERNEPLYVGLTETEKKWISGFVGVLQDCSEPEDDELMRNVYDICHDDDPKVKKNNQKRLFRIIYQLVLDSKSGPRIPLLVHSVGKERLIALLSF
ncbi:lysine--tRNA ligase [Fictibacillus barbaricus]|uniref:Lysine--tRNA ligase n=1 Tax=Fictibacillus barbaricus TaxID=182136 RepID=A0ABS2ZDX8_9BACL|nr:lysine--tRNA ligase [Fictibacillus barbaricus]MBN3544849.1 lysine--tRNA ligase [Fictibacillus barbaricus]GGB63613.1 lysine--tRNA ligase [Fictibacillus barbaricus]